MEPQSAQPILQRGTLRRNRKYGRYDFERFDHRSSTHASVGHATFDKVEVNCKFLFKKSQWGVLGEHKNPAGIIYLDLSFRQPKDSQLHSATVIVTLDDEDKDLHEMSHKLHRSGSIGSQCPIQITDCYGPKGFAGPEKFVQTRKSLHLTPNAQVLGYGFGGMGLDTETSFTSSNRWKFSGHLLPGKGNQWTYKTLKWDLSENDLEPQSTHSPEVHTAFTFEHGGQPFFMRVEIKGKLKKIHGRVKDKLMKFPASAKKEDGSVVTLINFGERISFKTPLDERARELEFEMEMANMNAIPMEVSDPRPVTYQNISQNPGLANMPTTVQLGSWSQPQSSISGGSLQQQLSTSTQSQLLQGAGRPTTIEEATDPTLANLAQAFVHLHALDRQVPHHNNTTNFSSTPVSRRQTGISVEDDETSSIGEDQQVQEFSEEQMLLRLLRMPAFLAFLRLIMGLLGWVGQAPTPTPSPSTVGEEPDERQRRRITNKAENGSEAFPRHKLFPTVEQEYGVFENVDCVTPVKVLNRRRRNPAGE